MSIRRLPEHVVNRIAAGEVVERPASVVKELVENALDAGARRVDVVTAGGGKSLIRVDDDGDGIRRDDLALAVARHCTSKLAGDDLSAIATLGFRGEALASVGAVARLSIESRHRSEEHAWAIEVEGGREGEPVPASRAAGTQVEVRDLFFATPARLKFLRSDRAEANAVTEAVRRLAIAHPHIRFTLSGADRLPLDFQPQQGEGAAARRAGDVIGADFLENAMTIGSRARGRGSVGIRRPADLQPREFADAVPLPERQAASRSVTRRRAPRGLRRRAGARPFPHRRLCSWRCIRRSST